MTTYEIAPHYDAWMMGDRFGDLLRTTVARQGKHEGELIAHLRMHRSGLVRKVLLADCTPR